MPTPCCMSREFCVDLVCALLCQPFAYACNGRHSGTLQYFTFNSLLMSLLCALNGQATTMNANKSGSPIHRNRCDSLPGKAPSLNPNHFSRTFLLQSNSSSKTPSCKTKCRRPTCRTRNCTNMPYAKQLSFSGKSANYKMRAKMASITICKCEMLKIFRLAIKCERIHSNGIFFLDAEHCWAAYLDPA